MEIKIKRSNIEFYAQIVIIIVLASLLIYNIGKPTGNSTGLGIVSASSVIPSGIPAIYGNELGIKYDDVSPNDPKTTDATIRLLGNIDRSESLESAEMERFINILYNMNDGISCEYCCGARSIIFENGQPACGCAHSYAMRGLTKYLIKYHGDEFTDEEILTEVGKWKVLFFPGIIQGKADVMKSQGIEVDYINLTTNKYRGIEQGKASGGMVGGC
ncbi:MAG: hypothetical protein AABX28_03595 [Nanoarchaeota archaeon]